MCGMVLSSYDDKDVPQDIVHVIETSVTKDGEDEEYNDVIEPSDETNGSEELLIISQGLQEDLVNLRLSKEKSGGFSMYSTI